jgi:hypothetical protein
MSKQRQAMIENVTFAATELGIDVVQEIAEKVLQQKPTMSLKDFIQVLKQQVHTLRRKANANRSHII